MNRIPLLMQMIFWVFGVIGGFVIGYRNTDTHTVKITGVCAPAWIECNAKDPQPGDKVFIVVNGDTTQRLVWLEGWKDQ